MFGTFPDHNRIASANNRSDTVEEQFSLAVDESPYLVAMTVHLIADTLACVDFQLLGKGFAAIGELGGIDNFVFAPAALLEHRSALQTIGVGLDVFALALVRDQDSVVRCRDN